MIDSLPHYLQGFICVAGFQPLNYQYYQGKYVKNMYVARLKFIDSSARHIPINDIPN